VGAAPQWVADDEHAYRPLSTTHTFFRDKEALFGAKTDLESTSIFLALNTER
jgi:hypothetical protein